MPRSNCFFHFYQHRCTGLTFSTSFETSGIVPSLALLVFFFPTNFPYYQTISTINKHQSLFTFKSQIKNSHPLLLEVLSFFSWLAKSIHKPFLERKVNIEAFQMAPLSSSSLMFQVMVLASLVVGSLANINQDVDVTWGDGRGKILNNGNLLTLSLDKGSGSGFQSKNEYLFGKVESQIKLVPGNSAGTVTTFYMSSQGSNHDEIDFEFLGNETGQPYTIHTNVFSNGQGNREMQFRLWFDPTADFHTYSILWNPQRIIFLVDDTPLRVFNNMESVGVAYPTKQPMRLYASLWDAEDWATQGGRVKTDWSKAPFTASYRNLNINKAVAGSSLMTQELDSTAQSRMKWVQKNYMIYNYCQDTNRFPQGLPKECTAATSLS